MVFQIFEGKDDQNERTANYKPKFLPLKFFE